MFIILLKVFKKLTILLEYIHYVDCSIRVYRLTSEIYHEHFIRLHQSLQIDN